MVKDAIFLQLEAHIREIIYTIKGSLKKEVVIAGQRVSPKTKTEDLFQLLEPELKKGDKELWDLVAERWLLKQTDVYYFFEQRLKKIDPEFSEMKSMEMAPARELADAAVAEFGAKRSYIFSVLNEVVFPKEIFDELKVKAASELQEKEAAPAEQAKDLSKEIARIEERYEKKLLGMQRKYLRDTEALKKQIRVLQKKIQ